MLSKEWATAEGTTERSAIGIYPTVSEPQHEETDVLKKGQGIASPRFAVSDLDCTYKLNLKYTNTQLSGRRAVETHAPDLCYGHAFRRCPGCCLPASARQSLDVRSDHYSSTGSSSFQQQRGRQLHDIDTPPGAGTAAVCAKQRHAAGRQGPRLGLRTSR